MADAGYHNADLTRSRKRLKREGTYRDLSTVIVTPSRADGTIPVKVAASHNSLMKPMNQRVHAFTVTGYEVGAAYQKAVEDVLAHPELSKFRYLLTLEDDNLPPADGLLRLYESIEQGPYAAVGGLYWTKGYGGQPMIYGDPRVLTFIPQLPRPNAVQECNGLGMGFTLFRLEVFRKVPKPWFKTLQEATPDGGGRMATQDLYYFEKIRRAGYKVACDTRVRVGHYDHEGKFGQPGFVW